VRRTEHGAHEWIKWNPPHHIQKSAIDPLLKAAHEHFKMLKEEEREKAARKLEEGDEYSGDEEEEEDDEIIDDGGVDAALRTAEIAEPGTVERIEVKEKLEKERADKAEKEREVREQKVRRRTDYNSRKTRRQRNAMVSGGGYALLDKVRDETGRGQVGIYEENITFDTNALNAQAKLILKRNDRANRYSLSLSLLILLQQKRLRCSLADVWTRRCTTTQATTTATTRSATKRRLNT
jgi:hypothetical protein